MKLFELVAICLCLPSVGTANMNQGVLLVNIKQKECNWTYCERKDTKDCIRVECINAALTAVPPCHNLPVNCSSVTELILAQNQIQDLPPGTFNDYTSLKLLDLSKNPIEKCQNGSFVGLSELETLIMSHVNPDMGYVIFEVETFGPMEALRNITFHESSMYLVNLLPAFCSLHKKMETIWLYRTFTEYRTILLNDKFTKCLKHLPLKTLIMESSIVGTITQAGFLNFPRTLQHVSLKDNLINFDVVSVMLIPSLHNVQVLDGSCQNSKTCIDVYPWSDWIPNRPQPFEDITARERHGTWDGSGTEIYLMGNLTSVYLHHTMINTTIPPVCWKNNNLINIDISFSAAIHIPGVIKCLCHLKFLNLRGIGHLYITLETFIEMSKLEVLMLGSSNLTNIIFSWQNASLIFRYNKHLKILDLSNLKLSRLHINLFGHLKQLEILILSQNLLNNVSGLFNNLTSIKYIDLQFNKLKDIPVHAIRQLEKLQSNRSSHNNTEKIHLRLDGNQFICTCSSIPRVWKVLNSSLIIKDANVTNGKLKCYINYQPVSFKEALKLLHSLCRKKDIVSIIFLTVVYPFFLCLFLTLTCCFRHRWKLQAVWFAGLQLVGIIDVKTEDGEYMFDAFVAYSAEDEKWVRTCLVRKLEDGRKPYKLCVHHCNFLPGQFIADNIMRAIQLSRKTILVITKSFLDSHWCNFESRAAQAHHLRGTSRIIAVVFPGALERAKKNPGMQGLLETVTYLEWSRIPEERETFWYKLERSLGTPLTNNTVSYYGLI